jgi:hypothetical protein
MTALSRRMPGPGEAANANVALRLQPLTPDWATLETLIVVVTFAAVVNLVGRIGPMALPVAILAAPRGLSEAACQP